MWQQLQFVFDDLKKMEQTIPSPLVSVHWLNKNIANTNLVLLDCTIPKITSNLTTTSTEKKSRIKGAIFFDIKNTFSDKKAPFPTTILAAEEFEKQVQNLGIQQDSLIICYDDFGIYSAPRVWWMFQLMGFTNIAVLDGGFPEWIKHNFVTENKKNDLPKKGNFKANYTPKKIKFTNDVLVATKKETTLIVDARSKGRFYGTEPEPRNDIKSGHIPNSINLPFEEILEDEKMKTTIELKKMYHDFKTKEELIFTCGSGITASILAFAAELVGIKNYAVYDGSWTEWGSTNNLPIEK